jgi:hypothetical protein
MHQWKNNRTGIENLWKKKTIVGVYTPTNTCPEKEKGIFWATLNKVLEMKSNKNEIVLMGIFNARVGKEKRDLVVGQFGQKEINNNGKRSRETCKYHNLKISNAFFEHTDINLHGYRKPGN